MELFAKLKHMQRKKWLFLLLIPLVTHLGCVIFFHFDENFQLRHFAHGFKKCYTTEVPGLDYSILNPILNQTFQQMGQGMQMTAFASADGKYVLKLFNPRPLHSKKWYWKNWTHTYSLKFITTQWFRKNQRLEKMFNRLKIAFTVMPEETGLVFVHLAQSDKVCHLVRLIDNNGKTHIVPLHQTPFVIQKRAIVAVDYFDELYKENRIEEIKQAIVRMEELFAKRLQLGITDRNQSMNINYGFIDGQPIQIDVGRIRIEEIAETEEKRILDNFHAWLRGRYPSIL